MGPKVKSTKGLRANYKEVLAEADRKYGGTPIGLGKGVLTYPGGNSANRVGMFAHHTDQFRTVEEPDVPILLTGAENIVGEYSIRHREVKNDSIIIKKVEKYADIIEKPNFYYLFIKDLKTGEYDIIYRKPFEDLSEDYGIQYNNEYIDSLKVGDIIPGNKMVTKSNSYDEYSNYRYGVNANVLFGRSPYNYEDAAAVREGFCDQMKSIDVLPIKVNINTNEIPINLHGDENHYKPFPDINEKCGPILIAPRPRNKSRALYDMTNESLRNVRRTDHCKFPTSSDMIVADLEIYNNNPDMEENQVTEQILKYYRSQMKYWQELNDTCREIEAIPGATYSSELDSLLARTNVSLDLKKKWRDGTGNPFENIQLRFTLFKLEPLRKVSKIVGRHGNKSVICKIIPDDEMPFTEDGTKIDVLFPDNANFNRTIAIALMEHYVGFIERRLKTEIEKLDGDIPAQRELLFDVVSTIDKEYGESHKAIFDKLPPEEQKDYMDNLQIRFRRLPMADATDNRDEYFFFRLLHIYQKYEWARRKDKFFVKKHGRVQECINEGCLGKLYILALKQTGRRGHSARAASTINIMGLPDHSPSYRNHSEPHKPSAIRFGFQEMNAMTDGVDPEALALDQYMYRTSPDARDALLDISLDPVGGRKRFKEKEYVESFTAQIYDVFEKSACIRRVQSTENSQVKQIDDKNKVLRYIKDVGYVLMSDYEYYLYNRRKSTEDIISEHYGVLNNEEFKQKVDELEMEIYIDGNAYQELREDDDHLFHQLDTRKLLKEK